MAKLIFFGDADGYIDLDSTGNALLTVLDQDDEYSVEFSLVSEDEIREINNEQRKVDKVTDVLSFPTLDGIRCKKVYKKDFPFDKEPETDTLFMGSIIICDSVAKSQAVEYGHGEDREFTYLLVHGLLHLFGYDHMTNEDKTQMRELEERVMSILDLQRKED